ncbi:MAG TPA: phage terminase large subunit, partial [Gemmatimonadales bacterium]
RQAYRYPNGSEIVVGGLDKPEKVMSTEFDLIYIQEATECEERDWEMATTRLRNGRMPYQQLIGDCNPDAPTHWLYQRSQQGQTLLLESRHEDNPSVTPEYLARLDALTGVRYKRLRLGLWVAAEGIVYEGWDPAIHRIDRFEIPADWPRYWVVDFGFTHPFVWQAWAEDPDGRLYRYREIYRTGRLVQDHAEEIQAVTQGEPFPTAIICDHDAEDRATLERYLGMPTLPAHKSISDGIQAVALRLRSAGDGKARLFFLRDSLVERDPALSDRKLPGCTEEEFDGYVWNEGGGRRKGEEPLKLNDHGADCVRYLVAHVDSLEPGYLPTAVAGPARPSGGWSWR